MARPRAAHPILVALLTFVLAACGGQASPSAEPSMASEAPSVAASAPPSLAPSTAPSEAPSPSEAGPAPRQFGMDIPVTITVPAEWTRESYSTQAQLVINVVFDRWLVFTTLGPDTVDAWVEQLTTTPQLTVLAGPEPTEVGGAPGYVLDVTTSDEAGSVGCSPYPICHSIFVDKAGPWVVVEGTTTRAWIVDVDGEPVIIVTDAPTEGFETWGAQMEEVLTTVEWGS